MNPAGGASGVRRPSRAVRVGDVTIGGGAPVSIQSMTNTDTRDARATLEQIARLAEAGCRIVRLAVPDAEAVCALGRIKKASPIPVVADVHFDHRLAVAAIEAGADKVRVNPGNLGGEDALRAVARAARDRAVPIRVGVNAGSVPGARTDGPGGVTAAELAACALEWVTKLEETGFEDIVLSVKASNVRLNTEAHRLAAAGCAHPFHIGLTEAGVGESGVIKSAAGAGALLAAGIGDTLRVSLTGDPVREVRVAFEILKAFGMAERAIDVIACPTCGRCRVDLEALALRVRAGASEMERRGDGRGLTVAVMGCAVNGPGEASHADLGVACGDGRGLIFRRGRVVGSVDEADIVAALLEGMEELWTESDS